MSSQVGKEEGVKPCGEEGRQDRWRRRVSDQVEKKGVRIGGEEGWQARWRRRV